MYRVVPSPRGKVPCIRPPRGTRVATLATALLLSASLAHADDGSMATVGGSVRLMRENANIRMVAETVRARITQDLITVDCTFTMKNEGSADTVLVGFPDGDSVGHGQEQLASFRSWVDGIEVVCTRIQDAQQEMSWWTKRVAFPAGAVVVMRNRYTVAPGSSRSTEAQDFTYILWTGTSWKGPIGSAEIIATLVGIPASWVTGSDPVARRKGRTFRWALNDFEPGSADGSPSEVQLRWRDPREPRSDSP